MFKKSLFTLVALITITQMSAASAQLKIGVYDNGKILGSLPSVEKKFKKLEAELEPKKKELESKQRKLLKLQEDIKKNGPVLSPQDLQSKQLEFTSLRRELQLLAEDTERVFSVKRNEIAREIQVSLDKEVIKLAQEQSYDLILRSGVLFASPKVDITDQILKRMSNK